MTDQYPLPSDALVKPPSRDTLLSLEAIPLEILQILTKFLLRKTFYSLCLVSRRMNEVFVPFLYFDGTETDMSVAAREQFIHLIIKEPELARHVKKIRLEFQTYNHCQVSVRIRTRSPWPDYNDRM